MLPRNPGDYRTLLWVTAMPVIAILQYRNPALLPYLCPLSFYLAMAAGTIAHNHNHYPTFANKKMSAAFAAIVSVFYGYPTFAWVPTHNLNHHKHVNKPGDATITWRHTTKHTALVAFTYFFVSTRYQSGPIGEYIKKAKRDNPRLFRTIVTQYVVWLSAAALFLSLAIAWNGVRQGLWLFLWITVLPSFFGTWTMMFFNYLQHVHCDPWSKHNHSRNITGRVFNFLVFNNGFHTVHHENAGAHWTTLPAAHAKIAHEIDPSLNVWSFWRLVLGQYVFGIVFPSLKTKQVGRAAYDTPEGRRLVGIEIETDSVDAVDAGTNAPIHQA